jgi:hypothetical protein
MNAALETAGEFLAAAKAAIDSGDNDLADAYISTARTGIQAFRRETRIEEILAHGRVAMAQLDHIEQVRRLCAYGLATGRAGAEAIEFCEIAETRPPVDTTKGLAGITPAFEWLAANRRQLSALIQNLAPSDL